MADLPKDYELNFIKHPKPNHVFSELNGSAIAVEGRIEHECHLRPSHITTEYRQLMKMRAKKSEQPRRTVQLIDPTVSGSGSSRQRMTTAASVMGGGASSGSGMGMGMGMGIVGSSGSSGLGGSGSGSGSSGGGGLSSESGGLPLGLLAPVNEANLLKRSKRRHSPDQKRERLPRAALLDLLFSAFERYSHWNLKGLVEYTRQPTIYLRELLLEIAVYNKKGPYKSTYQLKPEYKNSSNAMMKMSIIEAVDKRQKEKQMNGDDDEERLNESEEMENSQEDDEEEDDDEEEEEEVFMDA